MTFRLSINQPSLFVLILILICVSGANAQSKKLEKAAISHAKNYLVSGIETGMPNQPFGVWFQELVGDKTSMTWEINDCGEQTGTSADRGRDFPMCVGTTVALSADFHISVNIQYGTFKKGITKMQPVVRSIVVGDEIDGEWLDDLDQLAKRLALYTSNPQMLDLNTERQKARAFFDSINTAKIKRGILTLYSLHFFLQHGRATRRRNG